MLFFAYRVLHDVWLMRHPRMTLYLVDSENREGTGQKGGHVKRESYWCVFCGTSEITYSGCKSINPFVGFKAIKLFLFSHDRPKMSKAFRDFAQARFPLGRKKLL